MLQRRRTGAPQWWVKLGHRLGPSGGSHRLAGVPSEKDSELVMCSDRVLSGERGALIGRVDELQRRIDLHRGVLEQLEGQLVSEKRLLREIEELQDRRPQLRLERLDRQLKGRRLQEVAVEVLRRRAGADAVVHYREWFSLLQAEGFEVAGRDPVNTFLTNVNRAQSVERVGERSGLYRLAKIS